MLPPKKVRKKSGREKWLKTTTWKTKQLDIRQRKILRTSMVDHGSWNLFRHEWPSWKSCGHHIKSNWNSNWDLEVQICPMARNNGFSLKKLFSFKERTNNIRLKQTSVRKKNSTSARPKDYHHLWSINGWSRDHTGILWGSSGDHLGYLGSI